MNRAHVLLLAAFAGLALASCSPGGNGTNPPVTAANHTWFPLTAGANHEYGRTTSTGNIECASCHPASADSFKEFSCTACHEHAQSFTDRLHTTLASYAYEPKSCYSCHPDGATRPYGHAGIVDRCAECHAEGGPFAALPLTDGRTHRDIGASDCGACHTSTTDWKEVSSAPNDRFDPLRSVQVNALSPIWTGPTIDAVSPDPQTINMTMNHSATSVDANVMGTCSNCHAQADQGQYYPGVFHWTLLDLAAPQPTKCTECHANSMPRGFVGPVDSARTPASGEMRHDAVVWANGAPTTTRIVTQECVTCHVPPDDPTEPQWFFNSMLTDGGTPHFHASLTAAGQAQPTSCIDCHANTRPRGSVTGAAITFDHSAELGDCASCHVSFTAWSGGVYHRAGTPTPSTCLPCHASERPTSTTGWTGNYTASPFDYGTNADGVTHGAGRDCAECHAGSTQSWVGGRFGHGAPALAATRCVDCHTTQRPDLLVPPADAGFDHALNGTGDCGACHEATVTRGTFVNLYPIPGGDWRGGQSYPGATLISVPMSMQVQSTALTRDGGTVVGMVSTTVSLPNAFRHTSSAIPSQVFPGSATNPDPNSCWHCHTSTGTTVTAYSNGVFHASLTNYKATPASGITALPQPTVCNDCHAQMRPPNIVSKTDAGTWLLPMDHAATFTGGSVPNVGALDCGDCHNTPGTGPTKWSDGKFHTNLPTGASPSECVSCHWPLSTTAQADVTASTNAMKHRSPQVKTQACATCHTTALTRSTMTPTATTLWRTGELHANASPQPTSCTECHSASAPSMSTQGTVTYVLAMGGTSSNGAQWMNHADTSVTSRDCAACHQADAKPTGSAWSKSAPYHATVTNPSGCAKCHGTTNGRGTTIGTNNNLPAGLINSATTTTSSAAAAGTKDQISHADSNVTRFDCNFCHTQKGPSTMAGVQGKEWAQASFHRSFTTANPALYDGTAGRCSNCHMNVKPGSSFAAYDHSAFTATPGTQDCGACHSWPGTSATTPNWLGAEGKPHADTGPTAASTLDCNSCHGQNGSAMNKLSVAPPNHFGGITNGNTCTSCHINFAGFKGTTTNLKYAHTNATANAGNGCGNCHVFVSQLYTTLTTTPSLNHPVSAGSHQFSQTLNVTGTFNGDSFTKPHTDTKMPRCGSCHQYASTTSTTNIWQFKHRPSNPGISSSKSTSGCNNCH